MKRHIVIAGAALTLVALAGPSRAQEAPKKGAETKLPAGCTTQDGLWGYAIGRLLGRGLKHRFTGYAHLDWSMLADGFAQGVDRRLAEPEKTAKVGYLLGHWIGVSNRSKLRAYLPFVSLKELARGFAEGAHGTSTLTDAQGQEAIFDLQEAMVHSMPKDQQAKQLQRVRLARKRARAQRAALAKRIAAGRTFCEEYLKQHADAKRTASGLIYRVLTPGKGGRHPTAKESVKIQYVARLIDGTEFDNSYKRKSPVWFGVTQGLPGWVEAIQLMQPGAKWELVLPPKLAYDQRSVGKIKPGTTLVFQIELLEIGTPPAKAPPKK